MFCSEELRAAVLVLARILMILASWALTLLAIVLSFKKRMAAMAIYLFFFCFLTLGQANYLSVEIEELGWAAVLNSYISPEGFELAKIYVLLFSVAILSLVVVAPPYRSRIDSVYLFLPTKRFYLGLSAALVFIYVTLVFVVVGLNEFLTSSRPGYQSGATVFIVLLCIGVFPIIVKLGLGQMPSRWDFVLFLMSLFMTSAFSRIHSIMYLTMAVLAAFYGLRWAERRLGFKRYFFAALAIVLGAILFFLVGAARDALNFSSGGIAEIIDYLSNNPEKTLFSLEYNYSVGVEGMSGLSGAMTYAHSTPSAAVYDFGIYPFIRGALQWIPGFAKALLQDAFDWLEQFNWYSSSIVSAGIEDSYKSFGWVGFLVFAAMHYIFIWMPVKNLERAVRPKKILLNYLVLGLSIFMVRGSWFVWIAYLVTYAMIFFASWPIFSRYVVRRRHS